MGPQFLAKRSEQRLFSFQEDWKEIQELEKFAGIARCETWLEYEANVGISTSERDAYFAVPNSETRKRLITRRRANDRLRREFWESHVLDATKALGVLEDKASRKPWGRMSVAVLLCLSVGAFKYGLGGAVGGAILGSLFANWLAVEKRKNDEVALKERRRELEDDRKMATSIAMRRESFSLNEELTGEPDPVAN